MLDVTEPNAILVLPPTTSISAGPAPRNGMCRISTSAVILNSSPARCRNVPTPDEAYCRSPGLALASATSSLMLFAGRPGLTVTTFGAATSMATGAKDFERIVGQLCRATD